MAIPTLVTWTPPNTSTSSRYGARVEALDVPIYLHPRSPLRNQQRIYEGYPVLAGAPWGFGAETAAHTLRLILSGLFDRFPRSEEHTSELQSLRHLVCRLLLEKKKK